VKKINIFLNILTFSLTGLLNHSQAQIETPAKPRLTGSSEILYAGRSAGRTESMIRFVPPDGINPGDIKSVTKSSNTDCLYTTNAQLAALSTADLVSYLKSTSNYACHAGILFNYEPSFSPLIFTNEKIQAVANEIQSLAAGYDGTFTNGIYGLICYIHVAEYFDFYYSPVISIDPVSLLAIMQATDLLCINPHLFDLNAEAPVVLEEFLIILDMPGIRSRPATIGLVKEVMTNMVIDDLWEITPDIDWVTGYWRIYYLMFRGCVNNDTAYLNAVANDTAFISLWGSVATDPEIMLSADVNYLYQDNAILELSRVATNLLFTDIVCPYLATVCGMFPRLHKNWLRAIIAINDAGRCLQYDLCENEDSLRQEVKVMLFPFTYNYNDSNLVFKAKFNRDIADNLYYATRQTEAQLFRLAQTDQPVPGDTNVKLTSIVFESKQVYDDYAPFLYGIATNNGGMYLEQPAEFYTWDRPATYSLSLEELFRHEFNHYLQGRFLIPGYWGATPFYDNNRLTWYEEGHAEFLCASTGMEGIKLRQSTINRLKNDYPDCPTLAEVLSSYYGQAGSIYYPYGNLVWYNWYIHDYEKIKTFNDLTRNNDIIGFDNLVNSLKNSTSAQAQWQSFLTDVNNDIIPSWPVSTSWTGDQYLTVAYLTDICNEFTAISGMTNVTVTSEAGSIIRRFRIAGTITGDGNASNNADAAQSVNQALDTLMTLLGNDQYINNFDYTVGYITNVTWPGNVPTSDFHILGSLRDPAIPEDPVADFSSNKTTTLTGNPVNFESASHGYIKGYAWLFDGGSPSGSASTNPVIVYDTAGSFEVELMVTGKTPSITNTKTVANYIKVYEPSATLYCSATHGYDYSWISRVKIKDIDNSSVGFPPNGYSDFTASCMTELEQGSTDSISIELNYTNSPGMGIAVWIDFDGNGSFTDPGEQVLLAHPAQLSQLTSATIIIPVSAPPVVTRMRIRATYNGGAIDPCGADGYMGEVEDYTVVIVSPLNKTLTGTVPGEACYNASQTIHVAGNGDEFNIPAGGSVTMIAGHNILFHPGTSTSSGSWLWGYIAPAGPFCATPSMPSVIYAVDDGPAKSTMSSFHIYPNPTNGTFTLELTGDFPTKEVFTEIYGLTGEKVSTTILKPGHRFVYSLSDQPSGIYLIHVIQDNKTEVTKIIKL